MVIIILFLIFIYYYTMHMFRDKLLWCIVHNFLFSKITSISTSRVTILIVSFVHGVIACVLCMYSFFFYISLYYYIFVRVTLTQKCFMYYDL